MGRALQRALGAEFVLPEVEPREAGTSLLMNPRRQRVFEYVWNHPCSHLRRMSRELRIPPQSLRWHLLRLTGAGINLTSKASNKRGLIVMRIKATKKGAVRFTPINNNPCKALVRVGVVPPNPPVTG